MQTTRMPAARSKPADPMSGERDAWYTRPAHDEITVDTFLDSRKSRATVSPETALIYAVLEDAFLCLQKSGEPVPLVQRRAREAKEWFLSDDVRWIFSFLSVCEALGLDPDYMRKKVKDWCIDAPLDTREATR